MVFAFWLMSLFGENLPTYFSEALLVGWLGLAIMGVVGSLPYFRIARSGTRIEGRVSRTERRKKPLTTGRNTIYQRRVTYSYHVDGERYSGSTDWVVKKEFGKIEPGDPFFLYVDPEDPKTAYAALLVPTKLGADFAV